MHGSGLRKYHPSMHSPDKNEPKKMSNRKKALMALTASGILLWKNRDKLQGLIRPHQPYRHRFFEHEDPDAGEPIEMIRRGVGIEEDPFADPYADEVAQGGYANDPEWLDV